MSTSKAPLVSSIRTLQSTRSLARQLLSFTMGSGAGLVLDVGIFSLLVLAGVPALVANLISSAVAITTVYFLTTRFAFKVTPAAPSYVAFVAWYGASAVLTSSAISFVSHGDDVRALLAKAALVPITFATNFVFGRWLFQGGAEGAARRIRSFLRRTQDPERLLSRDRATQTLLARPQLRRRAVMIASVVTLGFAVVVLPMTDAESFLQNGGGQVVVRQYVLRAAFLTLLWFFSAFAVRFGAALKAGSVRHRRWLKAAIASMAVNLVLLAMIWPGFWIFDEFYVIQAARGYALDSWQGYLTNVFYTFGLYLFPSPVGILVFQLIVIAVVTGFVVSAVQSELRRPWIAALLLVPFLSFPVLLNNQYPLRLTMYAYLLLLLLTRIARVVRSKGMDSSIAGLLGDSLLVVVLAFWRTEGIEFLVLLPVLFVMRRRVFFGQAKRLKQLGVAAVAVALTGSVAFISTSTSNASYQMPPFINVLQTLVQGHLTSPHLGEDMSAIDAVAQVRVIKRNPDCSESLGFWYGGLRTNFEPAIPAFRRAFVDLVVHNPAAFLENRVCVFQNANSMGNWLPQVQQAALWFNADREQKHDAFVSASLFVKPIDLAFKNKVERYMLLWTAEQTMTPLSRIVWNVLPTVIGLLLLLGIGLVRRGRLFGLLSGIILINALAVFLTEPAAYFMYFFPAYLCGGVLIFAAAGFALDRRLSRKRLQRELPLVAAQLTAEDRTPALV